MKYGSMVYVYDWIMEEHQSTDIDYQPIWDDDYIEDSMRQYYTEFDEDRRGGSRFWYYTFPQAEFAKNGIIHGLLIATRWRVLLKREGLM